MNLDSSSITTIHCPVGKLSKQSANQLEMRSQVSEPHYPILPGGVQRKARLRVDSPTRWTKTATDGANVPRVSPASENLVYMFARIPLIRRRMQHVSIRSSSIRDDMKIST